MDLGAVKDANTIKIHYINYFKINKNEDNHQ